MNWGPIGTITPLAIGVAISPLPIVGMLVLLLTKGARRNSLVMLSSWILGNAAAIGVAVIFAGHLPEPKHGTDLPAEYLFAALIGAALIGTAAISYLSRRRKPHAGEPPAWLSSVDNLTPWGGAVIALSNAITSPKNLAFTITAGLIISKSIGNYAERVAAGFYYVLIATTLIAVPVVFFYIGGEKSVVVLTRWKDKITMHASAFIEIVLLVIGIAMTVRGLSNLLR